MIVAALHLAKAHFPIGTGEAERELHPDILAVQRHFA